MLSPASEQTVDPSAGTRNQSKVGGVVRGEKNGCRPDMPSIPLSLMAAARKTEEEKWDSDVFPFISAVLEITNSPSKLSFGVRIIIQTAIVLTSK